MRNYHYSGTHGNVRQLIVLQNKLNIKYGATLYDEDIIDRLKGY